MQAKLVFVTGSKSGSSAPLLEGENTIGRKQNQDVRFSRDEVLVSAEHAYIVFRDGRYVLRDLSSRNGTFVNRKRVLEKLLEPGDIIEFGMGGPSAQFVMDTEASIAPTLDLSDTKTPETLGSIPRRRSKAFDTASDLRRRFPSTRDFVSMVQRNKRRALVNTVGLVALLAVVSGVAIWQIRQRNALKDALGELAMTANTERGTRVALERDLSDIQVRYDSLLTAIEEEGRERRDAEAAAAAGNTPTRNLAARLTGGVGLIVYAYGFTSNRTGEFLRHQVDAQGMGRTRFNSRGEPVPEVDFGGDGPLVQRQGSATGFLIDSAGWILTNRHVAEPWRQDDALVTLRMQGFDVKPEFITLSIYFPPGDKSYPLKVESTTDEVDLALMRAAVRRLDAPVLTLSTEDSLVSPGEQVAFIGYPTGVHNLLFRVADNERNEILARIGEDPVDLARELGHRRQIQPLVTTGAISDTTSTEIIHTAMATGGGSGGPLILSNGTVVAIHYAAVRSPIRGDPFQTQRGVRAGFVWDILPPRLRNKIRK